jgi:hypothetical protein
MSNRYNDERFASAFNNAVDRMFPAGAPERLTPEQDEACYFEALEEVAAES